MALIMFNFGSKNFILELNSNIYIAKIGKHWQTPKAVHRRKETTKRGKVTNSIELINLVVVDLWCKGGDPRSQNQIQK